MMQVHLQKLANLNLAKNQFPQIKWQIFWVLKTKIMESLTKCKPLKIKPRGCTLQPKDLHPKREKRRKIESNLKTTDFSVK